MKTMTKKNVVLLAIGYKYNSTTTLCFVATENAGSTRPGSHYKAKYTDKFNSVQARLVDRPAIASIYFYYCGAIDQHNYFLQLQLWLEKHWVVNDGFKRIATTILTKCTVDAYLAFKHGIPFNCVLKRLSIQEFMPILVTELLANQKLKATKYNAALNLSLLPQIATAAGVQDN